MPRGVLLLSAGFLVCGLSAPALPGEQGASAGGAVALVGGLGGATIVDAMAGPPYDYPPPYYPRHHVYSGRHHYGYHHYAHSPYHRRSGLEPYSYYNPEK